MTLGRKLLRSSFVRTANVFLQIAVAFAMTPIIVHALGDRMYGFWILVGTFLGYYGLLDFGLSSAVARFLSRAVGQEDLGESNKIINTALALFSVIGVVVILLTGLAAILCGYFISNPEEVVLFRKIVLLLGLSMAISFPMKVFGGILDANLRHDLTTYASIARLLISNGFIYFALLGGYGIYALALGSFIAGLAEQILLLMFTRRVLIDLKVSCAFINKDIVRKLFSYSWKTFVAQLADILRFRVDSIVIAGYLNVGLITHYSVGSKLIEYFSQIVMSAVGMLAPVFSQYEGRGDYDSIRNGLIKATKISVILSVLIGSSIIFYGKYFIYRWIGSGYEDSYIVASILACSYILAIMQIPSLNVLYGISKHSYVAILNIGEGILNLSLSILFAKKYGIYGIAFGTAISMIIFKMIFHPIVVCKCINIKIHNYYGAIATCIAKCMIPLGFFYYFASAKLQPNYVNIIYLLSLQIVIFVIFTYFFILDTEDRKFLRDYKLKLSTFRTN